MLDHHMWYQWSISCHSSTIATSLRLMLDFQTAQRHQQRQVGWLPTLTVSKHASLRLGRNWSPGWWFPKFRVGSRFGATIGQGHQNSDQLQWASDFLRLDASIRGIVGVVLLQVFVYVCVCVLRFVQGSFLSCLHPASLLMAIEDSKVSNLLQPSRGPAQIGSTAGLYSMPLRFCKASSLRGPLALARAAASQHCWTN